MQMRQTKLDILRRERLPFVVLTVLALFFRLSLLWASPVLAAEMARDGAHASPLAQVICQTHGFSFADGDQQSDVWHGSNPISPIGAPHDPGQCICALACAHFAKISGVLPVSGVVIGLPTSTTLGRLVPSHADINLDPLRALRPIRAPPIVVT